MKLEDVKPGMRVKVVSNDGDNTVPEDIGRVFTVGNVIFKLVLAHPDDENGPVLDCCSACDIELVDGHPTIEDLNRGKLDEELEAAASCISEALMHIENARQMSGKGIPHIQGEES